MRPATSDFGTFGPAQTRRQAVIEQIISDEPYRRGHEAAQRLRYEDEGELDRLFLRQMISGRQFDAGIHLLGMYVAANLTPSVCAAYGQPRGGYGASLGTDEPSGRDLYRRFVKRFDGLGVSLLESVFTGSWPGHHNLARIRQTLNEIADHLKL